MILQASARLKSGQIRAWQMNSDDFDPDLETAITKAKAAVTEEVKSETKQPPAVVLVAIQGSKK